MSPRSHLINTCEHIRPRGKSRGARKKELRSGEYLLWQAELLAEGLWQPSRIRPSPARFSTPSACPRGHPRSLPLAGTDTSKSPNCDGQAERLRPGVPLKELRNRGAGSTVTPMSLALITWGNT